MNINDNNLQDSLKKLGTSLNQFQADITNFNSYAVNTPKVLSDIIADQLDAMKHADIGLDSSLQKKALAKSVRLEKTNPSGLFITDDLCDYVAPFTAKDFQHYAKVLYGKSVVA